MYIFRVAEKLVTESFNETLHLVKKAAYGNLQWKCNQNGNQKHCKWEKSMENSPTHNDTISECRMKYECDPNKDGRGFGYRT